MRFLLLASLLALALLGLSLDARPAVATPDDPPDATLAAVPAGTDVLLVQPRGALDAAGLEAALQQLGYETLPRPELLDVVRVAVPPGADAATLARTLADTGLATAVEPDARVRANRIPDDPLVPAQSAYLEAIDAPTAWDLEVGGNDVVVAVVDTGIDDTHPDLVGRLWENAGDTTVDGVDDDGNGCPDDRNGCSFVSLEAADPSCDYSTGGPHGQVNDDDGHGTFVAGVAAATGGNAAGIAGIAWGVRVLPVKVLDCTATGRISDAAAGIRYAARAGADIIVVAFGSTTDSRVLHDAVTEATETYGALIVASAGNEGSDRVHFPAAYPGVLAVGGTGVISGDDVDYRQLAVFSNFGPDVDLLAPGTRLLAPIPGVMCGRHGWTCVQGPYARASGTSFAAPLVAGAAALLYSLHPDLSPALAVALLTASGSPLPEVGRSLLDVGAALQRPLYGMGLPDVSRDSDGDLPGPGGNVAGEVTPTPPPPVTTPEARPTPRPPNTGGGRLASP